MTFGLVSENKKKSKKKANHHLTSYRCNRCGSFVLKESEVPGYPFYCPECDENLYRFEVTKWHQ